MIAESDGELVSVAEAAWLDEPSGHPLDPVRQPTERTGPIFTNCDDLMSPESSEFGSSTVEAPVVDAAQGSRESTTKRAGGGEFVPAGPGGEFVPAGPAHVPEDMWLWIHEEGARSPLPASGVKG